MDTALLLNILLFLPLGAGILIPFIPTRDEKDARGMAIFVSWLMLGLSVLIASNFNVATAGTQFPTTQNWISKPFEVNYSIGVDGLSLSLVLLTTIVTLLSVYASYSVTQRNKLYYSMVMLLTFSLLGVFMSQDLLQFFIFYEFELIPMYLLIAIWGGPRRGYAAMKFLL